MPTHNWHIYDHYGYAFLAVAGTFVAVATVQWALHRPRWAGWLASLQGVAPPFINIIGVLFGLTLAFLANDTWSAHDRAMNAVFKEADSLRSIAVLAAQLPEPLRSEVRGGVVRYGRASAGEWPMLAARQSSAEVTALADQLLTLLASPQIAAVAGDNVQALMLRKAVEIRDERDLRIGLSQTHVNPLKWLGMAFLGFLTLLSVSVVHVDKPRAAMVAVILFALAAAPTAAIVLIQGNPFQQPTSVTPLPIVEAVADRP
ncbi:MAG: DUF4239 domain-containing protein [Gammaproteobacteria bacterium]|nr:DUF4239 domain-containing protein [Gammaproteobacteria bacterium]MBU1602575.1 DUF4239 domain-containing protein [Gammaproteobacteria bacterium]MBU2433380.1 DUF4239 domain-containing protein [Gammaproteobacteria bacterium]MBU2451296.1 DUF4239 domain-containing protein [Gammaproteobacteria bacterium]